MNLPTNWKEVELKKYFSRLTRKNDEENTNVLTISAQYGLISQQEFFNKSIASEDKSNYFLLERGDFAYNKSYSAGYPFGVVKSLEKYDKGIVSPLYICFKRTIENKCPDYFLQYFEAGSANKEICSVAQEGARNHGLLNISTGDFFKIKIVVPPLAEQQKIAKILCKQDKIISLKQKLLEQKLQQKKWLMQKLLEVPHTNADCEEKFLLGGVVIDKSGWKKERLGNISSISTGYQPKKVLSFGNYLFINAGCEYSGFTDDFNAVGDSITTPSRGQGGIGFVAYQYQNFWCGPLCYQIRDNTEQNNNKYIYYYLNYTNKNIKDLVQVGTIPAVNLTDLEKVYISLPSLPEQKIIAQVLSTADKEIALLKSSIEQEKQKKKSLAQLLLTGTVRVKI